ncbi:uncharacterized protein N7477_007681 [Penicillium maclennaniae]|uniref:uncharacterized protein n=1 Tax=Penicillium maclennaniae TaxID=1343394 RepID=UPI0025402B8F|nr:uncharacterized protein N7477_007681 [Penicillium maclennaniae]KAJ5665233.1 hypothetical protein N7477_007681 [Penicillium maclennaniae]
MDATGSTAVNALPTLTKIPIAQLSPTLEELEEKCILATVSLVWPYSSSSKSLSLSLAEPDFRLRRSNGQVKATFHGRAAEKVAESHVGIGDTICLALKGADFGGNDAATQTPGRLVVWDLQFHNGVSLEITSPSKSLSTVIIEQSPSPSHDTEKQLPSTPRAISIHDIAYGQSSWSSPAFAQSGKSPFKAARDSAFDPFTDEDGSILGKGRKRPRYSFQRDDWRIESTSTSGREEGSEDLENIWDREFEDEMNTEGDGQTTLEAPYDNDASILDDTVFADQENVGSPLQDRSSVFVKPSLDLAVSLFGRRAPHMNHETTGQIGTGMQGSGAASHLPTDTPQLRPVPSPGLPIPSPIVSSNNYSTEYFSPSHAQQQAQTLRSIVTGTEAGTVSLVQSFVAHFSHSSQFQTTLASTERLDTTQHAQSLSSPSLMGEQDQEPLQEEGHRAEQTHEQSTEIYNSPTFQKHLELNEAHIEMGETDDTHMMSVAESVGRQPGETGGAEKAPDSEKDPWHEKLASGSESEGSEVKDVQGSPAQIGRVYGDAMVNAARAIVDMETAEDETSEHAPEAIESEAKVVEAALPLQDHPASLSSSQESDGDEHEALYDDHDDAEDFVEEDFVEEDFVEEDGVDEGECGYEDGYSSDKDPQTTQPPWPQQSQPEIIVLDSDSEDELASDQPASTPSQPTQRESNFIREPYIESRVATYAAEEEDELYGVDEEENVEEEEEEEEEEDYESDSDALEFRYQDGDDERVHDSDIDDESLVEELAHNHHAEQHLRQEFSIDEEPVGEEHGNDELDAREPRETQHDSKGKEKAESVIDSDSNAEETKKAYDEEPEEQSDYDSDQKSEVETEKHKQTGLLEPGSSDRFVSSLDGANDRDLPRSLMDADVDEDMGKNQEEDEMEYQGEDQEEGPKEENVSQPQSQHSDTKVKLVNRQSLGDTENQLPISDPHLYSPPSQEKTEVSRSLVESEQPREHFGRMNEAHLDKALLPLENVAPEPLPDTLYTRQDDGKDGVDVVVPTTEHAQVDQQKTKTLSDNKPPETPKVIITKSSVPDRHAHGLRSKSSYFAPLATLVDHYNSLVDTISTVYEATPIVKSSSGPRDYFLTVQLTDPSMAGTTLQAQIFRRTKSAMPSLAEGNAILLRDFKVRSHDHSIMLVSVESSSWAVFDGSSLEAHVSGPPVEYGSQERAYASGLRRWYTEVGASLVADNKLQASIERDSMDRGVTPSDVAISEAGSFESATPGDSVSSSRGTKRNRRRDRRVTIHELRDGTRYTEVGSPGSRESIHELRDGTVYADL